MQRVPFAPRPRWRDTIERDGLVFDDTGEYWHEEAAYIFTQEEVNAITQQAEELYGMCLEACRRILDTKGALTGLPEQAVAMARASISRGDFDVYGRFDVIFDPQQQRIKLLEFNADTPTSLLESAVSQMHWIGARPGLQPIGDVGNALAKRWAALRTEKSNENINFRRADHSILHLAHLDQEVDVHMEDAANTYVMAHAARLGGWDVRIINMQDILFEDGKWVDPGGTEITTLFKLYPWEDMVTDTDGGYDQLLFEHGEKIQWVEPAWKMGLSTKLLLPALWEAFPGHPSLVPAYTFQHPSLENWVRKPLFGREGAGVQIFAPDYDVFEDYRHHFEGDASVGDIWQEYIPLMNFPGPEHPVCLPVLGLWMAGDTFAGIGVRESSTPITDGDARFVPAAMQRR